jgi:hypothetical protein
MQAVQHLASLEDVRQVVVVYRINAWLFGGHEASYPALPDEIGEAERARRWQAYESLLEHLVRLGKEVILVLQAPELPRRIDRLVFEAGPEPTDVAGVDRSWWNQRNAYVLSRLSHLPSQVQIVDPASLLCDDRRCWAARGGIGLYFDDDHLSVAGASLVVDEVLRRVWR